MTAEPNKPELARQHLARVQVASYEPVDWSDLSLYGFYALENAVVAAADHLGVPRAKSHPSKVDAAQTLQEAHGLPDVAALLIELNALRKSEAYGETTAEPSRSAEQIATEIKAFVEAVSRKVEGRR